MKHGRPLFILREVVGKEGQKSWELSDAGWRREHAARVWAAIQAVAVFAAMWEVMTWSEDYQEEFFRNLPGWP